MSKVKQALGLAELALNTIPEIPKRSVNINDISTNVVTGVTITNGTLNIASVIGGVTWGSLFLPTAQEIVFMYSTWVVDLWLILGGTTTAYPAICLSGVNTGQIKLFTQTSTNGLVYTIPFIPANYLDTIKVQIVNNRYVFSIKRTGSVSFVPWFMIDKKKYPNVTNWTIQSLGFVFNNGFTYPLSTGLVQNLIIATTVNIMYPLRWLGKKWAAIGDSITAYNVYPPLVRALLGIDTVNNYGVSGTCITSAGSGDTAAMSITYSTIDTTADLITIFGGTNDFGNSRPLGTNGDTVNTTFYGALDVLLSGIVNQAPSKRIIIFTPLQRNWLGGGQTSGLGPNANGNYLSDYVNAIKAVAPKYSVPVLDLYSLSGICFNNTGTFLQDGVHPNTAGYTLISTLMAGFLANL